MGTPLDLFPSRVALVDVRTGLLTPEGYRAFTKLFERVGGANAQSNSELAISDDDDSGLEEFKSEAAKSIDGLGLAPPVVFDSFTDPLHPLPAELPQYADPMQPLAYEHPVVQQLLNELAGLREEVAGLRSEIDGMKQGTML